MAASRSPTVFGVHGFSRRAPVIGMSTARASSTSAARIASGLTGSPSVILAAARAAKSATA